MSTSVNEIQLSTSTSDGTIEHDLPNMPLWIIDEGTGKSTISILWLSEKLKIQHIESIKTEDISNRNRRGAHVRDGATIRLTVTMSHTKFDTIDKDGDRSVNDENILSLIMKQATSPQGLATSRKLGLAREALFYDQLLSINHSTSSDISSAFSTPKIYYSFGDFSTGEKCIIMEDLGTDSIDSGVLFGPGNPNNWPENRPNLAQLVSKTGPTPPSSGHVAKVTFREVAKVHAAFWKSNDLLSSDKTWLRGQQWLQGEGKESWQASQDMVRALWLKYLDSGPKVANDTKDIHWDANVRAAVEKAVKGISWEAQMKRLHVDGNYTLVHGDCWPGNFMWNTKENDSIRIIDWEMVGLGSGPQDLGQYVISNMDPTERKECEEDLIDAYVDEFIRTRMLVDTSDPSCHDISRDSKAMKEYCWHEYKIGGVERWIWFLVYFVGNELYDMAQFFHDQLTCFMRDHGLTEYDITQPRP